MKIIIIIIAERTNKLKSISGFHVRFSFVLLDVKRQKFLLGLRYCIPPANER